MIGLRLLSQSFLVALLSLRLSTQDSRRPTVRSRDLALPDEIISEILSPVYVLKQEILQNVRKISVPRVPGAIFCVSPRLPVMASRRNAPPSLQCRCPRSNIPDKNLRKAGRRARDGHGRRFDGDTTGTCPSLDVKMCPSGPQVRRPSTRRRPLLTETAVEITSEMPTERVGLPVDGSRTTGATGTASSPNLYIPRTDSAVWERHEYRVLRILAAFHSRVRVFILASGWWLCYSCECEYWFPKTLVLASICLATNSIYLSVTTCSSGGTVMKLRNQLSEQSAHSTVMVGQWASDPDLIAVDEFEKQLAEGWTRNKKRKAPATAEASGSARVIVIDDDSCHETSACRLIR
ncbi:hypothetical protein FB45DRAFT_870976 [Roridomyces roridus]|uniref:F-box domain-containing protein n=1 Tax=Roridomyces roridus TaxID=1738132 RepID=A0AAD7BI17_9AGAR|nr:hypothetical protein FB45DRAFT_870976 [Roridomyces roridus]